MPDGRIHVESPGSRHIIRTYFSLAAGFAAAGLIGFAPAANAIPAGQVYGSGYNGYGELGDGTSTNVHTFAANPFLPPDVVAAAPGYDSSLELLADGTIEAQGYNGYGELALGNTEAEGYAPVAVPGVSNVTAIAAGAYHHLALLSNGTVIAWGYNRYGELGNGTADTTGCDCSDTPVRVKGVGGVGVLSNVVAIAAGEYFSLALLQNGTVVAWGQNASGELGDETTGESDVPIQVKGVGGVGVLSSVVAISADGYSAIALLSNSTVTAWGDGTTGQLGNETTTTSDVPVQVKGVGGTGTLSSVAAIAGGLYFNLALLSSGTVVSWGGNDNSELGDGKTNRTGCNCVETPVEVKGIGGAGTLSNVTAISAGGFSSLALLSNGTLAGWGYNEYGDLGDGTTEEHDSPVAVSGLSGVFALGHGDYNYDWLVVQGAIASLSGSTLAFGNQTVGVTSAAQSVTLKNEGPAPLMVSGDVLTDTGAASFTKTSDTCSGATLAADTTCALSFTFEPSAAGTATAALAFSTTAVNALPTVTLSGTGTAPPPAKSVAPSLSALSLSKGAFRAAGSGPSILSAIATGTRLSYTDSQAATTTFEVQRRKTGVLKGHGKSKRCAAAPKHRRKGAEVKRCTYYKLLGSFTHADTAGNNSFRFTGRLGGKKLKPGKYRLMARAKSTGGTSAPRSANFRIVR